MKCEFCGIELDKDTKVCTECGFTASRPVMTEKSHHVIGAEKQKEINGNLSKREYKINQSAGFSKQSVKEKVKSVEKPKKKADLQKNQAPVQPQHFMVQGQSAESAEQVQKKNSEQHYIGQNHQSGAPQKQFKYTMPAKTVESEISPMTRKEFFNYRGLKKSRSFIFVSVLLLYFSVVYVFLAETIFLHNPFAFIDVIFLLAMLLLVQFKQSFKASVALGVYTFISCVLKLLLYAKLSSVWLIIATVFAIIGTYKFNKQWDLYLKTGFLPDEK